MKIQTFTREPRLDELMRGVQDLEGKGAPILRVTAEGHETSRDTKLLDCLLVGDAEPWMADCAARHGYMVVGRLPAYTYAQVNEEAIRKDVHAVVGAPNHEALFRMFKCAETAVQRGQWHAPGRIAYDIPWFWPEAVAEGVAVFHPVGKLLVSYV